MVTVTKLLKKKTHTKKNTEYTFKQSKWKNEYVNVLQCHRFKKHLEFGSAMYSLKPLNICFS